MMVKASPIRLLRCCSILCHRGIAESYLRSDDLGGGEKPHKIGSSRVIYPFILTQSSPLVSVLLHRCSQS